MHDEAGQQEWSKNGVLRVALTEKYLAMCKRVMALIKAQAVVMTLVFFTALPAIRVSIFLHKVPG